MAVTVTESNTKELLTAAKDPEVSKMANDIGLVIALTKVLNASLALGEVNLKSKLDLALGLGGKALATSELVGQVSGSQGLTIVNTTAGVLMSNKALMMLGNASPGKALATVGLVTFEKLFLLGGLQEKHKCQLALGSLATTVGLTAMTSFTGIGAVVGVIGVLAAGADAMNKCSM